MPGCGDTSANREDVSLVCGHSQLVCVSCWHRGQARDGIRTAARAAASRGAACASSLPRHPRPTRLAQQHRRQGWGGLLPLCVTRGLKSLLFMSHETIFMIRAVSIAGLSGASSRKHATRVSRQGWTRCRRCLSLRQRVLPGLLPARCVRFGTGAAEAGAAKQTLCGWLVLPLAQGSPGHHQVKDSGARLGGAAAPSSALSPAPDTAVPSCPQVLPRVPPRAASALSSIPGPG